MLITLENKIYSSPLAILTPTWKTSHWPGCIKKNAMIHISVIMSCDGGCYDLVLLRGSEFHLTKWIWCGIKSACLSLASKLARRVEGDIFTAHKIEA
jgi:hypothetical protein